MSVNIAVLGGGNGAYMAAADLTLKGHSVNMYEMPIFEKNIKDLLTTKTIRIQRNGKEEVAKLLLVTTEIKKAIQGVDWIFIIVPSFAHKAYAELLAPQITNKQRIVIIPGTFGSLEFINIFKRLNVKDQIVIAETDTLPWLCRLTGPCEVTVFHELKQLGIGVHPSFMTEEVINSLKELYPLTPHPNVLACGLNSLNPVLHVAGVLLNAGRIEYSRGEFYLYEEGYTPSVARVVEAADKERRNIAKAFGFNLVSVEEELYLTGYGPKGTFWQTIKGSYLTPAKSPGSLQSRYLTEDIAYGLVTWSQLGDMVAVDTSTIDSLITIASKLTGKDNWVEGRTLEKLGIASLDKEALLKKV